MKSTKVQLLVCVLFLISSCLVAGNQKRWIKNATWNNIEFSKHRYIIENEDTVRIIGVLKSPTEVEGVSCDQNWVQFNADGTLRKFLTNSEMQIGELTIPAGTWVCFKENKSFYCVFSSDTKVQGYICKGGNGPNGTQTVFYSDGKLKSFFSPRNVIYNGQHIKGGLIHPVKLNRRGEIISTE